MNNENNNLNNIPRRPLRLNSMRRRHEGLSPLEINQIESGISLLTRLLQLTLALPFGIIKNMLFGMATDLFTSIEALREIAYSRLDPIDPTNKAVKLMMKYIILTLFLKLN